MNNKYNEEEKDIEDLEENFKELSELIFYQYGFEL